MKRIVSLLLATLMIVALVPALFVATAAQDDPTSKYVIYDQNFEGLDANADSASILDTLSWYVPAEKVGENIATYAIVKNGGNLSLRISTLTDDAAKAANESFLTLLDGNIMSLVKKSDFTLSYDLTYRAGTTNADGYAAVIYNYNESGKTDVADGTPASYGIAAVRACGAGFNNVYYSVVDRSEMALIEGAANSGKNVMSNNFTETGVAPSLYKRIAETVGDDSYEEVPGDKLSGVARMIDKTVTVKLEYSYKNGVTVYINDVLVSKPSTDRFASKTDSSTIWSDFVARTTGTALGLVTTANVVADIDNIKVEAQGIADATYGSQLPELVITEINPAGMTRKWVDKEGKDDGSYAYAEYIEIYNPTDHPVDLSQFSLMRADGVASGTEAEKMPNVAPQKYNMYVNLGDFIGADLVSNSVYYVNEQELKDYPSHRYEYVGNPHDRYLKQDSGGYIKDNSKGTLCCIRYIDVWNSKYQKSNNQNPNKYDNNTMLNPGDTCLIFFLHDTSGHPEYWKWGTNAGSTSMKFSSEKSFRRGYGVPITGYSGFGLTEDTKVVTVSVSSDLPNLSNSRYYIGKAGLESGKQIEYTSEYINDPAMDRYIVSWCDWNSSIICGRFYEGEDTSNGEFNKAGQYMTDWPYSGHYIYGVDASDPRAGSLYLTHDKVGVSYSNVGCILEYQRIVLEEMYKKNNSGKKAELMITEIVPRTNNLAGEALNAFSAIELTNTSNGNVNLYEYTMVRSKITLDSSNKFYYVPTTAGLTQYTMMRAGNPVMRGEGNAAYYYFVDNAVSNPDTCILAPGETVVVWFLTDGTFQSYQNDEDFSMEYFRQYWVNNGNSQLALKNSNGEYVTKVIAVDANTSTVNNIDNADRVFDIDPFFSAIYGIMRTDRNMKLGLRGKIKSSNLTSFAFLGSSALYYKLENKTVVNAGGSGTTTAKILTRSIPANQSVRYIAGASPIQNCSALADTLKIQSWSGPDNDKNKTVTPNIQTHCGTTVPNLGMLDGAEIMAVKDKIFTETTKDNVTTYRYYDAANTQAYMLDGAVLDMSGSNPALRFDMAIPESTYYSLSGIYGDRAKIGIAIMETDRLGGKTTFASKQLSAIINNGVNCEIISRNNGFVVISAWVPVPAYNYSTSYSAIGYISIEQDDGTVVNTMANGVVSRSVRDVASAALEDTSYEFSPEYSYMLEDETFSRYSEELRAKMKSYIK